MLKFIIPGYYLFHSRLKSKLEKISWFIIYVVPIYVLGFFYTPDNYIAYTLIFILATLIFNSIYETGYMENDTKTILNEKNPTLRLEKKDYEVFKDKYYFIVFSKILVAIGLLFLVYILSKVFSFDVYIVRFIMILMIIRGLFYLHNKIRNRANIFTFFSLSITKYSATLFLILPLDSLLYSWTISFFLFPLLRTMEHATKEKYGLKRWIEFMGNHDRFRVKYYGFMLMFIFIIYYLYPNSSVLMTFMLFVYFFIYRISSYFLVQNKFYERDNQSSQKKEEKC